MDKAAQGKALPEWVRSRVSPRRFRHIQGVVLAARRLARRHGVDERKAIQAAWLHDCAKELDRSEMERWARKDPTGLDALERTMPALWHPHAAVGLAQGVWGVRDGALLEAIRCHTLGSPRMGRLAQAIFVADFIERGRDFPGLPAIRRLASRDLGGAVAQKCAMTIGFLLEGGRRVHPRLLETWNSFMGGRS